MLLTSRFDKDDKRLAIIKGGTYDGEVIYYHYIDPTKDQEKERKFIGKLIPNTYPDLLKMKEFKEFGKNNTQRSKSLYIVKELIENNEKIPKKYERLISVAKELLNRRKGLEIKIHDGDVYPLPSSKRECVYIAGPSGSGKSTFAGQYARLYRNMFPKNKIYIFSRLTEDKALDKIPDVKRVKIDERFLEVTMEPKDMENSLVIFDDIDTIREDKIKKAVYALKNDLLETGRHQNVYVVITSHLINNFKQTRTILNESNKIVVFPNTNNYSIKYVAEKYCGMSKKQIVEMMKLPTRWVCIHKDIPRHIIYQKGIYLLT